MDPCRRAAHHGEAGDDCQALGVVLVTETTMANSSSKQALARALVEQVEADLATLERAHRETQAAATHEEAKPENDKDTRALEQSYLARGQAARVQELRDALMHLRATALETRPQVALGALVTVRDGDDERRFFVMPAGGGTRLGAVAVVTPGSPWGAALMGAEVGEEREVRIADKLRDFEVLAIE